MNKQKLEYKNKFNKKNDLTKTYKIHNIGFQLIRNMIDNIQLASKPYYCPQSLVTQYRYNTQSINTKVYVPNLPYTYKCIQHKQHLINVSTFYEQNKTTVFNTTWQQIFRNTQSIAIPYFFHEIPNTSSCGRYMFLVAQDKKNLTWITILDIVDVYAQQNNELHWLFIPIQFYEYNFLTCASDHNNSLLTHNNKFINLANSIDIVLDAMQQLFNDIVSIEIISNNFYNDIISSIHIHLYIQQTGTQTLQQKQQQLMKSYGLQKL